VTLVDRENHHLFQPLLYQIATASLSASDIAMPIRAVLTRQRNATVLMADVLRVDLVGKRVFTSSGAIDFDYLVLAAGAESSYFGHDDWEPRAPSLKSLEDAVEIRRRVLMAFEVAEREADEARRRRLMHFAVIGGGPTGVELAGALSELARLVLAHDFRRIDPTQTKVVLVEAGPRVLPTFSERLSRQAVHDLQQLGVDVRTGARVVGVDSAGVALEGGELLDAATVIWAAGVKPSSLGASLGVPRDRTGRVVVEPDLSIPGHPDVFVIGDLACFMQGDRPLPGLSPVAMQEGRAVAKSIAASIAGTPRETFHYVDKGAMATIGRSRAVADLRGFEMWGWLAWIAWVTVHIWYLIGFRNRFIVMFNWAWSYVTFKRGARLILNPRHASTAAQLQPTPRGLRARPTTPPRPPPSRPDSVVRASRSRDANDASGGARRP
jgi:NADH dehydrogenase